MTGLIGEQVADDRCWIVKTHHPTRLKVHNFTANKIIICVRNPFDVLKSLTNFIGTKTHSMALANDLPADEPVFFWKFCKSFLPKLVKFTNECLRLAREQPVPVYFFKFEELVKTPEKQLVDVFKFLFDVQDI